MHTTRGRWEDAYTSSLDASWKRRKALRSRPSTLPTQTKPRSSQTSTSTSPLVLAASLSERMDLVLLWTLYMLTWGSCASCTRKLDSNNVQIMLWVSTIQGKLLCWKLWLGSTWWVAEMLSESSIVLPFTIPSWPVAAISLTWAVHGAKLSALLWVSPLLIVVDMHL